MSYNVKVWIGHTLIRSQDLEDPFLRNITTIGWIDRFKSLFTRKPLKIELNLWADRETIWKTMNMHRVPEETWNDLGLSTYLSIRDKLQESQSGTDEESVSESD